MDYFQILIYFIVIGSVFVGLLSLFIIFYPIYTFCRLKDVEGRILIDDLSSITVIPSTYENVNESPPLSSIVINTKTTSSPVFEESPTSCNGILSTIPRYLQI